MVTVPEYELSALKSEIKLLNELILTLSTKHVVLEKRLEKLQSELMILRERSLEAKYK